MKRNRERTNRVGVVQRVVATLALLVAVVAFGSTLRSFTMYGTVGCGAPLQGSKVTRPAPTSSFLFGREGQICQNRGHSKLALGGVVGILALVVGISGMVVPLGLPWWLTGEATPWAKPASSDDTDDPPPRFGVGNREAPVATEPPQVDP